MTNEQKKCCEKCKNDYTIDPTAMGNGKYCLNIYCPCHSAQQEVKPQKLERCSCDYHKGLTKDGDVHNSFVGNENPQPAPKEQEWEKELDIFADRRLYGTDDGNIPDGCLAELKSFIRSLLTRHADKARREELERYTVSWDIADGGKNLEVQFWRKESDGTLTCVTRLNKESDDGGSFSLSALTHPVETKEEK